MMRLMTAVVAGAALVFAAVVTTTSAGAAIMYSYVGNPLIVTDGAAPPGLDHITFSVTFPAALPADNSSATDGFIAWTISDGVHSDSSSTSHGIRNDYFRFFTDAATAPAAA